MNASLMIVRRSLRSESSSFYDTFKRDLDARAGSGSSAPILNAS